jgi:hypothetical protein
MKSYTQKRKMNATMKLWEKNITRRLAKQMRSRQESNIKKQKNGRDTTYLSIITLNIKGLNSLIKRH